MLKKIKGIINTEKKLGEFGKQIDCCAESFEKQNEQFANVSKILEETKESAENTRKENQEFISSLKTNLTEIATLREDLRNELNEIRVLKTQMKTKLIDELTLTFREELISQTERIKSDIKVLNETKSEISKLNDELVEIRSELTKFKGIASQVKGADFQLVEHAKRLTQADKEKLRLMKEIDNLQRLISKERRGRRR